MWDMHTDAQGCVLSCDATKIITYKCSLLTSPFDISYFQFLIANEQGGEELTEQTSEYF